MDDLLRVALLLMGACGRRNKLYGRDFLTAARLLYPEEQAESYCDAAQGHSRHFLDADEAESERVWPCIVRLAKTVKDAAGQRGYDVWIRSEAVVLQGLLAAIAEHPPRPTGESPASKLVAASYLVARHTYKKRLSEKHVLCAAAALYPWTRLVRLAPSASPSAEAERRPLGAKENALKEELRRACPKDCEFSPRALYAVRGILDLLELRQSAR